MPSGFLVSTAALGIGIVFESKLPQAVQAALDIFPPPGGSAHEPSDPPVYIVLAADEFDHTQPAEHRICGKRLHIAGDGIRIEADGEQGRANCAFRMDAIGTELFREAVHTTTLFMVAQRGRTPLHAAAIMIGECAYVLAGRSGSGKSTLALAANAVGLPVLAEDAVFVQLRPALKVWGLCDHVHIFEKDVPVGAETQTRLRAGRLKHAVPIESSGQCTDRAALCVLAKGNQIRLDPLSIDSAARLLTKEPEPGYDFYGDRMEEAIQAVAAGGCWKLTLSHDPRAAIATLIEAFGDPSVRRSDEQRHA